MLATTTIYAIRAASMLDGPQGEFKLVRSIAAASEIPYTSLSKILNTLCKRGIVEVRRGSGGGVRLRFSKDVVSFKDICKALRDPILDSRCVIKDSKCEENNHCVLHDEWAELKENIFACLKKFRLSAIADENPDAGPVSYTHLTLPTIWQV